MAETPGKPNQNKDEKKESLFSLIPRYWKLSAFLIVATIAGNGLTLLVPKFISWGIDLFSKSEPLTSGFYIEFILLTVAICVLTYVQGVFQTYLSEKAARDIRTDVAHKISQMTYARLQKETPARLLTNLTSDIEAIKGFLSFGVVTIVSSIVVILGAAILLLIIKWQLALAVLVLLPLIGVMFGVVFKKLGPLFAKSQGLIDSFNNILNESVVGAALVRVLNSGELEHKRFTDKNNATRQNGLQILRYFCFIIPAIGVIANLASIIVLVLGGHFVTVGTMSIGDFTAFNSYIFILIFPLIMMGFVSQMISQAQASFNRIKDVLNLPNEKEGGDYNKTIKGDIEVKNVLLKFEDKKVLNDVSFKIKAGTKTAIIGPTAAGKTQLLQVLMGLTATDGGEILYDGHPIADFNKEALYSQIALVFQESVLFNLSLRENVAFSATIKDDKENEQVKKAIETAELGDFIHTLPKGLDSVVSERGTSLSGGQKQRIMLARALAINPKIIFLDDFTARVDTVTERKILSNIEKNYPEITIVSVTQKIRSVEHFDKIILLMEGEVVAEGTHAELSASSTEYNQIMESQKSTEAYENKHE